MSEWKARVGENWEMFGLDIVWMRDGESGREVSNGTTVWRPAPDGVHAGVEPLRLPDEMGRALLAALLHYYNGADDARMLRKDYDAERKRVDLLIEKVSNPMFIIDGRVIEGRS